MRADIINDLAGLDPTAVLTMKALIQTGLNEKNGMDAVNLRESYGETIIESQYSSDNSGIFLLISTFYLAQAERFASGIPAKQFARIARKEIKHKL